MIENALFESHFDLIPFGIHVVDVATHRIVYANKAFKERAGDCAGLICHKVLYELDRPCAGCKIPDLLEPSGLPGTRTIVFERFNEKEDRWYQIQEKAMSWPDGKVVKYAIEVDISELKETQNRLAEAHAQLAISNIELRKLSISDSLTGLFNRFKLDELLIGEMGRFHRYGRPFSVIFGDLDHFKRINDGFGHQIGDDVLRLCATALAGEIRDTDRLGRWGGEEFLVVCPETDLEGARELAEKLRLTVKDLRVPGPGAVTMSFGVAQCAPGDGPETLMARADAALYAAKAKGRNRVDVQGES